MIVHSKHQALCAEPYWLPYLSTFQFVETRISQVMQLNHVVSVVLDLINSNKYVPRTIVIHAGESDFRVMPQHLIKFFMAQMSNTVRDLIRKAQQYKHSHISMFVSMMLPQQWYYGWLSQKAARKAKAHFNGCLTWAATLAGQYMVNHPELSLRITQHL